jgi:hypothetical protein
VQAAGGTAACSLALCDHALQIDIHVLDHTMGYYRLYRAEPRRRVSVVHVPVSIQVKCRAR